MDGDGLIDPWHVEEIASPQIFLSDTTTIGPCRADLIAKHLVKIPCLGCEPVVDERLWIGPVSAIQSEVYRHGGRTYANDSRKSRFCFRSRAK